MKRISQASLLGASLMLLAGAGWTADDDSHLDVGKETRQWLELQRSGSAASETERPLSADAANRSYQRYVETHSYRIPRSFTEEKQSFVQD